jgi:hypothetical protein
MKCVLIACLAACSAPSNDSARAQVPHVTWTPHVQAPLGPSIVDVPDPPEPVAQPLPRARVPGRRAPCFSDRDVLIGFQVWQDVERYAIGMSADEPEQGRYGTCAVSNGELRDANGTVLAHINCGLTVYTRGIIDEHGFEIGASGADIAAAHGNQDIICWPDGDTHTRCWISDDEHDDVGSHYVVAGSPAMSLDTGVFRGAAARDFFTARNITHFMVRMNCH